MDKSFHPQRSETWRFDTFFTALLKVFDSAILWLVGFNQLSEEEQMDAGIYLDHPRDE